ncbi:MAG: type II secretion system protein [Phycisphaerae bacterium]|nr:type II secretion system protein [Phycisphaerae bacterium]
MSLTAPRTLAGFAGQCALGFVLLAGLLKSVDLSAFRDVLASWRTLPESWAPWVGTFVPTSEVLLGGAGVLGLRRRWSAAAAMSLLALFTAAYVHEWALGDRSPACGCLGAVSTPEESGIWVVARNVLLMGALAAGLWSSLPRGRDAPARAGEEWRSAPAPRGFTLVETLIVMVLVAMLVALAMPTLGRVRERARVGASLANLRSHASIIHAYAGEHREHLPYLTSPTATFSVIRSLSAGVAVRTRYFGTYILWNVGLADAYYDGRPRHASFRSPLRRPDDTRWLHYALSCSFQADPDYYAPETRTYPPEQWRATRLGEVLFPSGKTLLADDAVTPSAMAFVSYQPQRVRFPLAFVDASAAEIPWSRAGKQMPSGDGGPVTLNYGHENSLIAPLRHALHGVRGRDVIR